MFREVLKWAGSNPTEEYATHLCVWTTALPGATPGIVAGRKEHCNGLVAAVGCSNFTSAGDGQAFPALGCPGALAGRHDMKLDALIATFLVIGLAVTPTVMAQGGGSSGGGSSGGSSGGGAGASSGGASGAGTTGSSTTGTASSASVASSGRATGGLSSALGVSPGGVASGVPGAAIPRQGDTPSSSGTQGGSGSEPKGVATLRAEQNRGIAASPTEEKQKTDLIEKQANEAIQKTQRETAMPATGAARSQSR
jgi:hypothetical protein